MCVLCAKPFQSCLILWSVACQDPLSGILQARILEWVAMPFSKGTSLSWIKLESLNVSAGGFFTTRATYISFCRRHLWLSYSKSESHSVLSNSLRPHGLYTVWNSLGQNTRMGSLSLLQEIFPTQGLNPGLPHCRWILC